jgi:YebC/PmpR family DNA-binding regulatory protein
MSGHNKWSSIKHKKAAVDAKRGKIFTKLIREITVAAKTGGGNPETNNRLRAAIAAAKEANMPKDNIEKAIKRGTGELEGVNYEEIRYEGYGPSGAAVLVEVLTDNRNRAASEIRHIFSKNNGSLGESGCVSWLFDKKGLIIVSKEIADEDTLFDIAIEAGADDIKESDDSKSFEIISEVSVFEDVKKALVDNNIQYIEAAITMIPQNSVKLAGKDAENMIKLMNSLEDSDDVQKVYSNFDIDDSILEKFVE